jgi:hypothetical protein
MKLSPILRKMKRVILEVDRQEVQQMDAILKKLLGRGLSPADEKQSSQNREFRVTEGFNPSDAHYDPQVRLQRSLRALFPHLPATPGLPPSRQEDES